MKQNILLVDDNKLILDMLSMQIKNSIDNIEIHRATTYKEAVKCILNKDIPIHVAIIDVHLPDCDDGAIIQYATKKGIPTIVLTGTMDESIKGILSEPNILDFVVKGKETSFRHVVYSAHRILKNYDTNILVVDDSQVQLKIAVNLLEKNKLNVVTATNGEEAYNILENSDMKFSLILTDYNMPKMDGMEFTLKVRDKYDKDTLGIIVLSSTENPDIPTQFIQMGANDFLNKPYSEIEVRTRINSNLDILDLFEKTRDMANKDFLTGMYNRRYFFENGELLYQKAIKKGKNISVAMFDIDKFKNINDTYGHDIGDIAIIEVANVVDKYFEKNSIIARFGGEEFCVIQIDKNEDEFLDILETIRKEFENNIITTKKGDIKYTVSIGYSFDSTGNLDDMVNDSDAGLYKAKTGGRNQVRSSK